MSAQAEQFKDPGANDQFPTGHAAHEVAPADALKNPAEHMVQTGEFSAAENEPAAHETQPLLLPDVPAGHEHARLSPAVPFAVKPDAHVHVDGRNAPLPAVEFDALGHLTHADAVGE